MSVLTDQELRRVLGKEVVTHPLGGDVCFSSKGYDLRVGYAVVLNVAAQATGDPGMETISIPPKTSAFIITREYVWLSEKLVGTFHVRGGLAAKGLLIDS